MSGLGGRRDGAGRKLGVPNKATREIKELAQVHGPAAIGRLALLAGLVPGQPGAESEQAQIMACRELLDRGFGKATQIIAGDEERPHRIHFTWADAKAPEPEPATIEAKAEADGVQTIALCWSDGTRV
jgi:hypothetical protein